MTEAKWFHLCRRMMQKDKHAEVGVLGRGSEAETERRARERL